MSSIVLQLWHLLVPTAVAAGGGYIQGVVNGVISGLPSNGASGGAGFVNIADAIVSSYMPVLIPVAVLALGILGLRMVISQEDEIRQQSKSIIAAIVSGLVLANLISPFLKLVYGGGSAFLSPGTQAGIVNSEIGGVIDWALGLLAAFAVFFIVVTAVRIMAKGAIGISGEDDLALLRRTIGGVAAGILLIVFKTALLSSFTGAGPGPLLAGIARVVSFILSFTALAATAVIIYAGIRMVMNFGNEEAVTEGRSLILRVIAGLVLILTSLAIVQLVVGTVS